MRIRLGLAIGFAGLASLLAFCLSQPASAITFGFEDTDNVYSNVGSIVLNHPVAHDDHQVEGLVQVCSGTLIHPRVLLTAGHCTNVLEMDLEDGFITLADIHVSFSPVNDMDPRSWHDVEAVITHPDFSFDNAADWHDVGVLILKKPVLNLPIATLAYEGFLDDLKDAGLLRAKGNPTKFIAVGYGVTLEFPPPEVVRREPNVGGPRRYAETSFRALLPNWLDTSQNTATGDGGTGYGDSGGPKFWRNPDTGELVLVALTSKGDPLLVSNDISYRVDIPQTLDFIEFVLWLVD